MGAVIEHQVRRELGSRPLTVYGMPATRNQLLPLFSDGMADVAVCNLSITEEVIVTGPNAPTLKTHEDLSDAPVHVRKASSYYESQNKHFRADRRDPFVLIAVPDSPEDEDPIAYVGCPHVCPDAHTREDLA